MFRTFDVEDSSPPPIPKRLHPFQPPPTTPQNISQDDDSNDDFINNNNNNNNSGTIKLNSSSINNFTKIINWDMPPPRPQPKLPESSLSTKKPPNLPPVMSPLPPPPSTPTVTTTTFPLTSNSSNNFADENNIYMLPDDDGNIVNPNNDNINYKIDNINSQNNVANHFSSKNNILPYNNNKINNLPYNDNKSSNKNAPFDTYNCGTIKSEKVESVYKLPDIDRLSWINNYPTNRKMKTGNKLNYDNEEGESTTNHYLDRALPPAPPANEPPERTRISVDQLQSTYSTVEENYVWFRSGIEREDAELLLEKYLEETGSFVVRHRGSTSKKDPSIPYSLSVVLNRKCYHLPIKLTDEYLLCIGKADVDYKKFSTLGELVSFYTNNVLTVWNKEGSTVGMTRLKYLPS